MILFVAFTEKNVPGAIATDVEDCKNKLMTDAGYKPGIYKIEKVELVPETDKKQLRNIVKTVILGESLTVTK